MTPVATANIHEVVSASLCAWITESLEQFGVDSRVFLRVIQSVLEQDIQSLRGEERLNDLWSYRLESIGSKRKPMSKEDLLRRVLLENMRPCFKEDESFIAEEFVDELLFRWNEEMKTKAETCRNKRERGQFSPEDLDEEKIEDTRDPVTQYHEAFPALVTVRIADSCGMDEATITNTQLHFRRPPAVQHRSRRGDLDKLPYCQFRGARGCRNAPGRFMDRCLGSRHPRHRWTDRGPAFGFDRSVFTDDASRQFSVENYGIQSTAYQGSVFDRFVAQIFKTAVPQKGGSYPPAGCGPWHDRTVPPFGPMPVGFLHRTIEKILSQGVAGDSVYEPEPGHVGVGEVYRQLPDVAGNHKLPIYMEDEFGVLVCVSDGYGICDAKNVGASDDDEGTGCSSQRLTDLPAVCISTGVALPNVYRHTLSWTQSENQRMPYVDPSYWGSVDVDVDEDSIGRCLNSRYAASCLGLPLVDMNPEIDDVSLSYAPESGAPPDYGCRSPVLGNFRVDGVSDLWTRIPNRFVASPAEIKRVSRHVKDGRQGQAEGSVFADSDFVLGTAAVSGTKRLETCFDKCSPDCGDSSSLYRRARRVALSGPKEDELTSGSSQSIASLVAEISERDLMNHLATSLAVLFPDLLMPRPLYLPEAEMLACIGVQACTSVESRYVKAESYPYDYWLYLYSALSRGDVNVDQILNYNDFRQWRLCVLNQVTGSAMVCTCGLCCRGSGCLMDSIHRTAKSTDAINRTLSTRATEHPAELHITDVDYNSGSRTLLKLAENSPDVTDEGIDIYEFVLNNSSQGKTVFSRHGFALSSEDAPRSDYGRASESFVTDWNKIKTIWTSKDRSFSSDAHRESIFFEELYEENNNKVAGSSNLFSWGSHWISDRGERKSGHMSSSCESAASPSALSVDFGYDAYGEMSEKAENDFVFGRSSLPPSPSSVAFSQLLSSEEEVSCDGWRVALDGDSRWLNTTLCRSCKACLDARRDSPASSRVVSSSECGSPSLDCGSPPLDGGSPSLDSGDALQYVNLLWCVDDGDGDDEDDGGEDDDAGSLSEDLNEEETEVLGCVHETKAFDGTIRLSTLEGVKAIDDALVCSLGNSQLNVPYRSSSSSLESDGTTDGLNSDETASLSFLSAKYSVDSKLCESDLSSSEPAADDLLVESSQSDVGSGNYEFESSGACVSASFGEERPDFMHPTAIRINRNEHKLSVEEPYMNLPGVELVPKVEEDCGNTGVGFENFEQLRVLWKTQPFGSENLSDSDREDLGYDVFSPDLGIRDDPTLFQEFKPGLETSVDPISKSDENFESINSKSLLKFVLDDEESSGGSVTTESLEDAGLEKIRKVKVLWDTGRTDDENANRRGSIIGEEKVDANKLDHLKIIWSQLPLESKNLEELALAWRGQVPDYDSVTSFGLKTYFGQNPEATSHDVKQKLLQDSYNCLSTLLSEGEEVWDSVDGVSCQHPCPSLSALGSSVDQQAVELETLLQEVEFNNSRLVAALSGVTGACLPGHVDKAENRAWQEVAQIESVGLQEQDVDFKNFQGLASIWDNDKSCCEDVGSIDCDLNIGHVTDLGVVVQMESGMGSMLNSCPDRMILESLEPSEFCCEAVGDEVQQFKGLKSIWEEPPMTLEPFPHQASFHAGFSTGITQMSEETVGCDIISDDMQSFEHIKCIWDAPQAIAECTQIPLHFQTHPVGTIAENSSSENQRSFELAANVKPFVEDVDLKEQDNLENNEELTLIWEKKKARSANVKTSIVPPKEKCQHLVSVRSLTPDENQLDKDESINWDNKKAETEDLEVYKIPIEEKKHSNSFCQKTLSCETYGEEKCAKNIEQLKSIWEQSEPDMESGNGSMNCWGEPAPVTQNPAEELPQWDLSQIENGTVAEKSVWHPSKSNSNSSENLSLLWDKCERATENLSELAAEPAAPLGYIDEECLKDVKCHWNDARADLESASGSLTGWKKADSDADAFAKLHCEAVLSDFESCKDKLDKKLLFDETNVQDLASGSCWAEPENKPKINDLTLPVDGWDATNRSHEQSLDPEKLNKLRALWEDNEVPQAESLRRVASLSCWEQPNPDPDGLRRISSESLWEPLNHSSENLSRADSALRWQQRDSSLDSLRHVAEDICWDNDALVMDSLKQKSSTSCHNLENLPDMVPVWHDAQAVDNKLRSSQGGDNAFSEEFKELQSIWQNDQFAGENLNKFPRAIQSQDAAAVWSGTLSESRCLPAKFDSISQQQQQQQLEAEDDESERFTDEMMDKLTCELFYQIDQADCDPCYLQAGNDRNIWLCSASNDFQGPSAYVGGFGTESDELNRLISQLDERQFESRGFKGLLTTDVGLRRHNLASEWQLVEAFSFVKNSAVLSTECDLWRLILQDESSRPKLVPSENTAFRDKIPHRFAYRYSFFDPREACRHDRSVSARTETIKHIYDPSHSIMRQLEDVFDDGQRLQAPEDAFRILPNRVFRPIGGRNSGRDSHPSDGTSVCSGADLGDLVLQVRSPTLDAADMRGPDSPYQLYFGAESKSFVPRFRVHKELEKSAQTGEATPPMQNNEAVCNMNVILSTMALLD